MLGNLLCLSNSVDSFRQQPWRLERSSFGKFVILPLPPVLLADSLHCSGMLSLSQFCCCSYPPALLAHSRNKARLYLIPTIFRALAQHYEQYTLRHP